MSDQTPHAAPPHAAPPRIGIISLGCPKALVDSERIITKLRAEGYDLASTYDGADVVIVNTCGFLDSSKAESLDVIGEAMQENGRVIVTGCMGGDESAIRDVHPNVLNVSGPHQYEAVVNAVHEASPPPHDPFVDLVPEAGLHLTPRHYAYLKISEGCHNRCSFCIIPHLRGDLVSRAANDVMYEAERLARAGVKELLVISQDTSAYGLDLKYAESSWNGKPVAARMLDLCENLATLDMWVRLHYVYPYPHVDGVIPLMAEGKILPYLDIPFQHASPEILKAMKRPAHGEKTLDRINQWRRDCPDLTLRSTFIVGFPGETDDDVELLLDWLDAAQLDRVGCFKYEAVAGAPANELPGHVDEDEKTDRWERVMELQREISERKLATKVGKTVDVIIDELDSEGAIGRTKGDAPDVDGSVFLDGDFDVEPGDIVSATITESDDFDLFAKRNR